MCFLDGCLLETVLSSERLPLGLWHMVPFSHNKVSSSIRLSRGRSAAASCLFRGPTWIGQDCPWNLVWLLTQSQLMRNLYSICKIPLPNEITITEVISHNIHRFPPHTREGQAWTPGCKNLERYLRILPNIPGKRNFLISTKYRNELAVVFKRNMKKLLIPVKWIVS